MKQLSKQMLHTQTGMTIKRGPEKILQFGKGNFLRGFFNWLLEGLNRETDYAGSTVIYQPNPGGSTHDYLKAQDYLYTVCLQGMVDRAAHEEYTLITSVSRTLAYQEWNEVIKLARSPELEVIVSNTTEAGLTYQKQACPINGAIPSTFPAKLTSLLYERFKAFEGIGGGIDILPCELVQKNGDNLKEMVCQHAADWDYDKSFYHWLTKENDFCNTLVDRIVTGYPKEDAAAFFDAIGYEDRGLVIGEPYHLFVIEGQERIRHRLPFAETDFNVRWGNVKKHSDIKVRLLNAPHTIMTSLFFPAGYHLVRDVMESDLSSPVMEEVFHELAASLPYSNEEKHTFIEDVQARFCNPYNDHYLHAISMSGVSKFKTRILPAIREKSVVDISDLYALALAGLLQMFRPSKKNESVYFGKRMEEFYPLYESETILLELDRFWTDYQKHGNFKKLVEDVLSSHLIWEEDARWLGNLTEPVTSYLNESLKSNMVTIIKKRPHT
ncbi:tagaturonate reductase [Paenalkalicoccus suaedae]|uniref:Tagaturonate reductase n=1 Tax=Paenalkalicoccus suaedae TaxID=2592382 RepID=A0A859FAC3_9BACI|nr:tagaturonate reductase [Paenalkalicoccus suaedae]QKS69738.1 tagaturonate reductase [Paenalkalicoccus suaedae]